MSYRFSRRLTISGIVLCILIIAFILVLPEVVRRIAVDRLQNIFTEPVAIANVDINLFTGRAAVDNLVIGKPDASPMLTLPSVQIDFSQKSLLSGKLNIQKIVLKNPRLLLERFGPGKYNLLTAIRKSNSPGAGFSIHDLQIDNGEIDFVDYIQKPVYRTTFSSLDIAAGPISTLPNATITPTQFTLGVKVADGIVKLSGSATPFQTNLNAQIKVAVTNVQLQRFQSYLPYEGRLDLKNTLLNGQAQYMLERKNGKITKHAADADIKLTGVALLSPSESQPVAELGAVKAQDVYINLLDHQAQIGSLVIENPQLRIHRNAAGFNFEQLLPGTGAENKNAPPRKQAGSGFAVAVKHFQAEGGIIEFVDQTVSPAVEATLQNVDFVANGSELLPSFSVDHIDAKAKIGNGALQVNGALHSQPIGGTLSIAGQTMPYQPFTSYGDQLFNAATSSGESVDAKLTVAFTPDDNKEFSASITGQVIGKNIGLEFSGEHKPFFQTQQLGVNLKTVQLGSTPAVDIDRIWLTGAQLQAVRTKDGKLNLAKLWAREKEPAPSPDRSGKQASRTAVKIGSIAIGQSEITILDQTVSPNYRATISSLSAKISDLIPSAKHADIDVQGVLGNNSQLALNGWFTPFSAKPYVQLEGTIKSYDLPRLNPYATEYVDHRIRRGQLTTEVKYTLNGDQLQAKAQIVLRDVRVGEKTGDAFQNRIGIPLNLAVALLQDVSGAIHLQVDVTGKTGPRVNIRDLIWAAVRNAILKAITAPFRLVGKIFTVGGKIGQLQIEPIFFESGTAKIATGNNKQLVDLAKLLKEKPRLQLELQGQTSQQDLDAVKKNKFWDMLQNAKGKDYQAALVRVYKQMGGSIKAPTPLPAATETVLENFILDHIEIFPAELQGLARKRAEAIKEKLQQLGVDSARLTVSPPEISAQQAAVEIRLAS